MKYVSIPLTNRRRPSFFLAMEEYMARHTDEPDCFFLWQVESSVVFGRNQLIANEVNQDYCRREGIGLYRRKSGGGCIYADMGNVMLSYITTGKNVGFTFNRYINMVVLALRQLGIEARATGRNDIMIGEGKVSGSAFYQLKGRSIVHGTMLYDTDMERMVRAITPSGEKLASKGVESVRQRIALLKDHTDIGIEAFKQHVRQLLCGDRELVLNEADMAAIEKMETEYLSDAFVYGHNPRYTVVRRQRIEGVGEMEAHMELKNGVIADINLLGDFFITGDLDGLLEKIRGVALERQALQAALPTRIDHVIVHMEKDQFINLLLL